MIQSASPPLAGGPPPVETGRPVRRAAGAAATEAPAPAAVTPRGKVAAAVAAARRAMEGTPGRLRLLALLTAGVAVLFGLAAGQAFKAADGALSRAQANTAQLVRIQSLHTSLVRADANATNAFLVGGLEPASTRAAYDSSITQAAGLIAEASRAQPADGRALASLNRELVTYTGLVEQARANNRQALPLGAQYLRNASLGLRSNALPIVDALVTANEQRVRLELDHAAQAWVWLVVGLLALVVLTVGMVWLARRTHRYVNLPLAAATGAILLTLVLAALALAGVRSRVADVRDGPYAATLATARARIAAFDAKSNESLTLIYRGSGATFESSWKKSSTTVDAQSRRAADRSTRAAGLADQWAPYVTEHTRIRTTDDGGGWDAAVTLATGSGPTSANGRFDAFDKASAGALAAVGRATADGLSAPRSWLPLAGAAGLLVGILAALSAWWGVSLRLEEYR